MVLEYLGRRARANAVRMDIRAELVRLTCGWSNLGAQLSELERAGIVEEAPGVDPHRKRPRVIASDGWARGFLR